MDLKQEEDITHLTAMSYNFKVSGLPIREAISASCWLVRKRVSKTEKTNHMHTIIAIHALVFTALGESHLQHLSLIPFFSPSHSISVPPNEDQVALDLVQITTALRIGQIPVPYTRNQG